ncbi:hypothetical protein GCM10023350_21260 [Nocardioides endophyticus]|uniref:CdiI immunity protein domain-containing protein n=2 Tax=Nocardioides endophyticus TaxID=1353775 RepID=A0ABP8YQL5_9ACTN
MIMSRSALSTFVGVYLDEDIFENYANEFEAVDDFAGKNPELASKLPAEILSVLGTHDDEASLEALLQEFGIGIDTDGLTYREWLTQIADRVRAATV